LCKDFRTIAIIVTKGDIPEIETLLKNYMGIQNAHVNPCEPEVDGIPYHFDVLEELVRQGYREEWGLWSVCCGNHLFEVSQCYPTQFIVPAGMVKLGVCWKFF
jgi:hypothetical protein